MSTLVAASNINFTSASWLVCDPTSLNDTETTGTTSLSTSYQESTAFTPGAIVVCGVMIKIASRAAGSPSNTITVRLAQAGADVAGTVTTMNVSDIDVCSNTAITGNEGGWYFFKFNVAGTPTAVTLSAATAYTLSIKMSATTTGVNCYSLATNNWARFLVTTTTAAPASGDRLAITGDNLSAGVKNSYTVTMDNTAATSFGTTATQAFTINKGGTLQWGTSASTAYQLKVKGVMRVFSGGTYTRGTAGTPMPSTSTAVHTFDATGAVDSGLEVANGGTLNDWGATKTPFTLMTADKAATNTVISGLTSTSGWVAGDVMAFESTTITAGQAESKTTLSIDSSTQVTLTAGLTNAHSGTAPTQARCANLTRNNRYIGASATLVGYLFFATTATVTMQYVEVTAVGNSTTNKRGIDILTTTASITINGCSIHDNTQATAIGINIASNINNVTITNNVIYNINACGFVLGSTVNTSYLIDTNLIFNIQSGSSQGCMSIGDLGGVITNNICSSATAFAAGIAITSNDIPGTFSGNVVHSCANGGFGITGAIPSGTLGSMTSWRNTGAGLSMANISSEVVIDTYTCFGNTTFGATFGGIGVITMNNSVFNAGVTQLQPVGLTFANGMVVMKGNNNSFGATTTHATADISVSSLCSAQVAFTNTLFSSGTEIATQTNLSFSSYIGSQKHDQTAGLHKMWRKNGTMVIDTVITDTTPSLRMTPNTAAAKFQTLTFKAAVASGNAVTASIKVRESVVGDGTAYNGNRIRLFVKANVALGINSDTLLVTATGASSGAFELISGTTAAVTGDGVLEFYLDCDGTTGWVNIDTASFTPTADTKGLKYYLEGFPFVTADNPVPISSTFG